MTLHTLCTALYTRSDAKIAAKQKQVARLELSAKAKEDLKNVALGTSKINYMDPRITVAWCGRAFLCRPTPSRCPGRGHFAAVLVEPVVGGQQFSRVKS